ncbi:hypothetical protein LTR08_006869 [Meristemomyces frigidus]|nr:hypothetical protein LTR08_006869 [Meristemomyces frigidus]
MQNLEMLSPYAAASHLQPVGSQITRGLCYTPSQDHSSEGSIYAELADAIDCQLQSLGSQAVAYAQDCEKEGLPRVKLYETAKYCLPLKINKRVSAGTESRPCSVLAAIDHHLYQMGPQVVAYARQCEKQGLAPVKLYEMAKYCLPLKIKKTASGRIEAHRAGPPPPVAPAESSSDTELPSRVWRSMGRSSFDFVR